MNLNEKSATDGARRVYVPEEQDPEYFSFRGGFELIDIVFCVKSMNDQEVRDSLIDHDGYPPNILVISETAVDCALCNWSGELPDEGQCPVCGHDDLRPARPYSGRK